MIFLRMQLTAYFNDVVEENGNPVDHKANDHYQKVYIIEALLHTFIKSVNTWMNKPVDSMI